MIAPPAVDRPLDSEPVVLHVEDDAMNRRVVEAIAHRKGLEIHLVGAETGADGLRLAFERSPALILLDLDLPDMRGQTVLANLRDDARTNRIPIVVVSGQSNPTTIAALLDSGADDYVTKPFDIDQMMDVLHRADPAEA